MGVAMRGAAGLLTLATRSRAARFFTALLVVLTLPAVSAEAADAPFRSSHNPRWWCGFANYHPGGDIQGYVQLYAEWTVPRLSFRLPKNERSRSTQESDFVALTASPHNLPFWQSSPRTLYQVGIQAWENGSGPVHYVAFTDIGPGAEALPLADEFPVPTPTHIEPGDHVQLNINAGTNDFAFQLIDTGSHHEKNLQGRKVVKGRASFDSLVVAHNFNLTGSQFAIEDPVPSIAFSRLTVLRLNKRDTLVDVIPGFERHRLVHRGESLHQESYPFITARGGANGAFTCRVRRQPGR